MKYILLQRIWTDSCLDSCTRICHLYIPMFFLTEGVDFLSIKKKTKVDFLVVSAVLCLDPQIKNI